MTSSSTSYPIRDILSNSDTSLGKLIAKAQAIENLNQTFQNILDPSLIPHCRIATYENGILIRTLLATENAWEIVSFDEKDNSPVSYLASEGFQEALA